MGLANLVFVGQGGHVAAMEQATGTVRWKWSAANAAGRWGTLADMALLLDGEALFVGWRGELYCLDAASGKELWHNKLERMYGFTPALATVSAPRGTR